MGQLRNLITPLHTRATRDYAARMADQKVHCSEVARQYGPDYWDGDRRYGYGGYHYDGRWKPVAERLIEHYQLLPNARILDVGCGKAHLLHELKRLLPQAEVVGFDISSHGIEHAPEAVRPDLFLHNAEAPFPYPDLHFDLALSIMTLHNLELPGLVSAASEMQRVARQGYIAVESYRNPEELYNLQCWALTCESFLRPDEWVWLFGQAGYTGDYEFAYFE
jgi:SAM-dependent methyltransferase